MATTAARVLGVRHRPICEHLRYDTYPRRASHRSPGHGPTLVSLGGVCYVGAVVWRVPKKPHETFHRNTLVAVIAQLRFDPILKVQTQYAAFQDLLRGQFPGYAEVESQNVELGLEGVISTRVIKQFHFSSKAGDVTVVLGDQSIGLEYRAHRQRSDLLRDSRLVFEALNTVFAPVSPTRIGLRYVNVIDPERMSKDLGRRVELDALIASDFLRMPCDLADHADTRWYSELTSAVDGGGMTLRYGVLPVPETAAFRLDVDRYTDIVLPVVDAWKSFEGFADDIFGVFCAARGPALVEWMNLK
jgi:uncharacterized protein (TIGR04255 family)